MISQHIYQAFIVLPLYFADQFIRGWTTGAAFGLEKFKDGKPFSGRDFPRG
jgi:hypothetical protein